MRIVNLTEFLQQPKGTLFIKFEDSIFTSPLLVLDTVVKNNDYYYINITRSIDWDELDNNTNDNIVDSTQSFNIETDGVQRDGTYDKDQLFAIYEKEDIKKILQKLHKGYTDLYTVPYLREPG